MRIALLAHAPVLGGSTDLTFQARDFFLQRGHAVQVIFGSPANSMDPRAADSWILPSSGGPWRERMRQYIRRVEDFRPDLAYAFSGATEMDLFRFLRCIRVRHVSSLERHGFADIPFWLSENRAYMEACTANSPDALEEVQRYSQRPTFLLPYRLPPIAFPSIQIPAAPNTRPIEVAFVSRLESFQKRAHWLPKIIRHCEQLKILLKWHVYGDGPEGVSLRRQLGNNPNVTFHGWLDRTKLYQSLPRHDLFFLCSRWEGLPISMVEAMGCGLACVAPDIPSGIHWTLTQGGGWLYPATSPQAAADALATAVRDRPLLLEKRREALRLSRELFATPVADEQYLQLEAALERLAFNGHVLDVDTAPKFRPVRFRAYFDRLAYGTERFIHSPRWLLTKLAIGKGSS